MFTECPTCNTVFRVYPAQLEAAGGRVRCGECLAVFDAREYRRDDLEEPVSYAGVEEKPLVEAPSTQGKLGFEGEPGLFEQELSTALSEPPPSRVATPPAEPAAVHSSRSARAPAAKPRRDPTLDLPFGHEFTTPPRQPRGLQLTAGLLLLVLLAVQYLWFNRLPLSRIPALQPAVGAFCGLLPCGLESVSDPSVFELTGRAVQSHPSYEGALLVDVTFVNRSNMARPYPGLELVFTDLEGNAVASRRFAPAEYQGSAPEQPLAAGGEAHAALELLDPGDLAAGYEFRFF